jgi:hypothetical protein
MKRPSTLWLLTLPFVWLGCGGLEFTAWSDGGPRALIIGPNGVDDAGGGAGDDTGPSAEADAGDAPAIARRERDAGEEYSPESLDAGGDGRELDAQAVKDAEPPVCDPTPCATTCTAFHYRPCCQASGACGCLQVSGACR